MKITKTQLTQIIKEELEAVLSEEGIDEKFLGYKKFSDVFKYRPDFSRKKKKAAPVEEPEEEEEEEYRYTPPEPEPRLLTPQEIQRQKEKEEREFRIAQYQTYGDRDSKKSRSYRGDLDSRSTDRWRGTYDE